MPLQRAFVSGLVAILPLVVTIYVLVWVYNSSAGILSNLMRLVGVLPPNWLMPLLPILGIVLTLALIALIGLLVGNYVGKQLMSYLERSLNRIPIVGYIYKSVQQISSTLFNQQEVSFSRAAVIEYPRKGLYTLCFVIQEARRRLHPVPEGYTVVLVPTSPVPASGMVIVVPTPEVMVLDISVEEALRYVVSGGFLLPEEKLAMGKSSFDPVKVSEN
jgi:uncharacterized membrane protein